jgi:hypothetical protein
MTKQEIKVGSLVTAKGDLEHFCRAEESGVCYEVYEQENQPGYRFIFQGGRYDKFSPAEVNRFLEVSGRVSKPVANYQFKDLDQLHADYRAGRFDAAFEEQNIERAQERSSWPQPLDVVRREYDENLRREAYGIEPKRTDFDLDR